MPSGEMLPSARFTRPNSDAENRGSDTPRHSYTFYPDAPHYSHQEFTSRKAVCNTGVLLPGGVRDKITQLAGACSDGPRNAGNTRNACCDDQREALNKWHQHLYTSACDDLSVGLLLHPGDQDCGDSSADVKIENRTSKTPHWSNRQFEWKKNMHKVPVHKTAVNAVDANCQSTTQTNFSHPRNGEKPPPSEFNEKNSHAHMCLAKRRHDCNISGNCEKSYRSEHPPQPAPLPHYFSSPEPNHMAANLYPDGPSVTARHYPNIFCNHIVAGYDPYASSGRHGVKKSARSGTPNGRESVTSSRISQEARERASAPKYGVPVDGVPESRPCRPRPTSPNATPKPRWTRDAPSKEADPYNYYVDAGSPPRSSLRSKSAGHVYRGHAQLQYDKSLCKAAAFRHSPDWERIGAGERPDRPKSSRTPGSNSEAARRQGSTDRTSKTRSRSADQQFQSTWRQSPRASSSERTSQRQRVSDIPTSQRRSADVLRIAPDARRRDA